MSKSHGFVPPQVSPASTKEYQPRAGLSAWCVPSLSSHSLSWLPALSTGIKEENILVGAKVCGWMLIAALSAIMFLISQSVMVKKTEIILEAVSTPGH